MVSVRHRARSEVYGANAKNTVDVVEALSSGGDADGLICDDEGGGNGDGVGDWLEGKSVSRDGRKSG